MNLVDSIIKQLFKFLFTTVEEKRPWGSYKILYNSKDNPEDKEESIKIKLITVNPKQRLSLQSHKNRNETWLIISGEAKVYLGSLLMITNPGEIKTTIHKPGDHIFIEKHRIHRIENTSEDKLLIFCEFQTGESFEEDDIIRYEDDYGRVIDNK